MFLLSPDVFQVMSCGIGQEYSLQMIQPYIALGIVLPIKMISQAINVFLPVFQLVLLWS